MSTNTTEERLGTLRDGWTVPWLTVGALAITTAYGDGFLITSLRGATGAVERNDQPFLSWLVDATVVLPLFAVAVWGALRFAHRRYGGALRKARNVMKSALLVAAAASVVGIGTLAASSAYDYALQVKRIESQANTHFHGASPDAHDPTCTGACASERASLELQGTAVAYGSAALLLANVVIVGWVVALRGGRLEARKK